MSVTLAPLAVVVAMSHRRVIGRAGTLPWHIPEDLKHFRRVTTGHAIIMGRKTYDSIGRALPDRRNIVVSRSPELRIPGCDVVSNLAGAIALARETDEEPRVIGGAVIFEEVLPSATKLFLTEIDREIDGDTFFPVFSRTSWRESERREVGDVAWLTLERV